MQNFPPTKNQKKKNSWALTSIREWTEEREKKHTQLHQHEKTLWQQKDTLFLQLN